MGKSLSPSQALVKDYAEYLRYHRKNSPHTQTAYTDVAIRLLDFCRYPGHSSIENHLNTESLRAFFREASHHLSASSQSLWVSAAKNFILWLQDQKKLPPGLEKSLFRPKVSRKLVHVFDEEDLPLILKVLEKRPLEEQLLFELLYGSGLRLSEALNLSPSQIDLSQNCIHVLGKGRKKRHVPLRAEALKLINKITPYSANSIWPKKLSPRALRHWVEAWGKRTLLNERSGRLHPHKLRHSIATHFLRRGARLPQIQKLLGHSQLSTTERYTHLKLDDLLRVYDLAFPEKMKGK